MAQVSVPVDIFFHATSICRALCTAKGFCVDQFSIQVKTVNTSNGCFQ